MNKKYRIAIAALACLSPALLATAADPLSIESQFTLTGHMGDGVYGRKHVIVEGASVDTPHSAPSCTKVTYTIGQERWAGAYWLNKAGNWGALSGENYATKGFTKLTFWAKGAKGGEVVEFKAGGISQQGSPFQDSFVRGTGKVTLTNQWTEYTIPLTGLDLSSVIGGFCWTVSADNNGEEVSFYMDDIIYQ